MNMPWRWMLFALTFGLLLSCMAGCAADKACVHDDVCPKGQICQAGECREGCKDARDCRSQKPFCQAGSCTERLCEPGQQRPCYEGPKGSEGKGSCKAGSQSCTHDGMSWGPCLNQGLPRPETCDRVDNDCDGQIDEDIHCQCEPGSMRSCYTGPPGTLHVGACTTGTQFCLRKDYQWGECTRQVLPSKELCDGADNDCNGIVDDPSECRCQAGKTRECYDGGEVRFGPQSSCKKGTQICSPENRWGPCLGSVKPREKDETCGKDEDCDGAIKRCECTPKDTRPCGVDYGACKKGTQTCQDDGTWSTTCEGEIKPSKEICNGIDDDCDGKIDTGCPCTPGQKQACGTDAGECKAGQQVCEGGAWSACNGELTPTVEICDNKDNNCNGDIDESLEQPCYPGPASERGVGLCKAGKQTCTAGVWGPCKDLVLPATELCNGKDDDCDGKTDEALTRSCFTSPSPAQADVGVCKSGTQTCQSGAWSPCTGQTPPRAELRCNGIDEDCDGKDLCDSWIAFVDGSGDEQGHSIVADGQGNVFAYGQLTHGSQLDFKGQRSAIPLTPTGPTQFFRAFVLKWDAQGQLKWSRMLGSNVFSTKIAVGPKGHVAVAGYFKGRYLNVPHLPVYDKGSAGSTRYAAFVAMLDPTNDTRPFLWARVIETADTAGQEVHITALSLDSQGNVYVGGNFNSRSDFIDATGKVVTSINRSGTTGHDIFIARLDAKGTWTSGFIRSMGGPAEDGVWDLAIYEPTGGSPQLYVTGFFEGAMTLETGRTLRSNRWDTNTSATPETHTLYLLKFDAAGKLLWSAKGGESQEGTYTSYAGQTRGMAVDPSNGDVYLAGQGQGALRFGNVVTNTGSSNPQMFVVKCSTAGTWQSIEAWLSPTMGEAIPRSIALAGKRLYITGSFTQNLTLDRQLPNTATRQNPYYDGFVFEYSLTTGKVTWSAHLRSSASTTGYVTTRPYSVFATSTGIAYVAGTMVAPTLSIDFPANRQSLSYTQSNQSRANSRTDNAAFVAKIVR